MNIIRPKLPNAKARNFFADAAKRFSAGIIVRLFKEKSKEELYVYKCPKHGRGTHLALHYPELPKLCAKCIWEKLVELGVNEMKSEEL